MELGTNYTIERLDDSHKLSKFSVGADEELRALKTFLKKHSLDYQSANIAVTYVAALPPTGAPAKSEVIGYITLTCSEVDLGQTYLLDDCEHANRYSCMPALKIARLAGHSNYRGSGIGKALMDFAVALAADHIGLSVGCRFLVTDAKRQSTGFYVSQGFTLLDTPENHARPEPVMFLDLNKLHQEELPDEETAPTAAEQLQAAATI